MSRRAGGPETDRQAASAFAAQAPRGLVWVNDARPGICRERKGDGFVYRVSTGDGCARPPS